MKKTLLLILITNLFISCEKYTVGTNLTLSGKYSLSLLDVTSVDQNTSRDSLYRPGTTYINHNLPHPFDSLIINRFYMHFTYSEVRLNQIGVDSISGRDNWQYGSHPYEIFYKIYSNNSYNNGFIQFDYRPNGGSVRRLTFLIEDDGFESLQLKSAGSWSKGKFGEKQVMTFVLTRVGP